MSRTQRLTPIPRYALYDEPVHATDPRFVHVETIASRSAPRDWTIRTHAHHDLHQLLLIVDGGGEMRAEAERRRFGAASLLVVPAGLVHGFAFAPDTRGHIVTIADALLRPLLAEPALAALMGAARAATVDAAALEPAILGLAEEIASDAPLAPIAAEARLRLLMVCAARALPGARDDVLAAPGRQAALVARFRAQIETRLGEGWPVARHAAVLGVSLSRLRAACVAATGMAPIRLIQERTAIEARRLLAHGAAPVSAIGYALGFTDAAYFSRWFARIEGRPPAAYRRAA